MRFDITSTQVSGAIVLGGLSNPADLPSRGLTTLEVSVSQLWQQGPEWLCVGLETCDETNPQSMPEECTMELRKGASHALTLVNTVSKTGVSELIDCKRFSSLSKLLRVTAQVLRAIEKFKKQRNQQSDALIVAQMSEAELLWVKDTQHFMTQESEFESQRRQFNLFEDEKEVWRCKSRLTNIEVPYAVKNPILLPRSHPLTTMLVREAH